MNDFLLIYRADYLNQPTGNPQEMQALTKKWMDWVSSIAAQNKLTDRGNRLKNTGRVLKPGNVTTDGPFCEMKEIIGGYSIIKAESMDEAEEIAKGCPVFTVGGSVEVREVHVL